MNLQEKRELLEIHAEKHLYALMNSEVYGRDEHPNVYITEGVLQGLCVAWNLKVEIIKRREIVFYKILGKYRDKEKYWFNVVNENVSEEWVKEYEENNKKAWKEKYDFLR